MKLIVLGVNHKTAPIEIREKFYLTSTQQDLCLSEIKNHPAIAEAFVLSTCNRTEIYLHALEDSINLDFIFNLLGEIKKIKFDSSYAKYFYIFSNQGAVRHLLRVVSGMDSLVLGEKQILGQVKSAVENARQKGLFSKYFNILSASAIRTGKIAQHQTLIGFGGSSVSWAAIAMAEKMLGSLQDKSLLVIGAGEMSKLAVGQISDKGFRRLYVMNRTECAAEVLAKEFKGIAVSFCDIKEILSEVDLCICCASAPHYILERGAVEKIMALRGGRKLVFIDISMPRNIDPDVVQVENVLLFEIDDLDKVVEAGMIKRQAAVTEVEKIIEEKSQDFYEKISRLKSPELVLTALF